MKEICQNQVIELDFQSKSNRNNNEATNLEFNVSFKDPNGKTFEIPGFWAGGSTWRARYASPILGEHSYKTSCSNQMETDLNEQTGIIKVIPYQGSNPLYMHGRLQIMADGRHIKYSDGNMFFWLGDTWWMGLTKRLHWPDEFALLTKDRVGKGFTLIQIIAGLYPDMPPFDERGANEAGFPWKDNNYEEINPEYFDLADRRIQYLVDSGLVPCIVGFWGYFMKVMGIPALKKHWRYIIARYGSYPIIWCIAGEAMMKYYLDRDPIQTSKKQEKAQKLAGWSNITQYVRNIDGFHNPITIHPTQYGHEQLDNPSLLDIDMLQTGHANKTSELKVVKNTVKMIQKARKQNMPVVVGEVCYEGILEANRQEIQRCLFWASLLSGAAGYTYGANGIWQLNRRDQSYGASPHGKSWGETPWEDAYQLPGSKHIGISKSILDRLPWWKIEPHPEWMKTSYGYSAGIPGQLRIFYRFLYGRFKVEKLEQNIQYDAILVDPKNGKEYSVGIAQSDKKGIWISPEPHVMQDWVLILKCIKE